MTNISLFVTLILHLNKAENILSLLQMLRYIFGSLILVMGYLQMSPVKRKPGYSVTDHVELSQPALLKAG